MVLPIADLRTRTRRRRPHELITSEKSERLPRR